jgi:hypothetical protein
VALQSHKASPKRRASAINEAKTAPNRHAAKMLGLTIPQAFLATADEAIE